MCCRSDRAIASLSIQNPSFDLPFFEIHSDLEFPLAHVCLLGIMQRYVEVWYSLCVEATCFKDWVTLNAR